MTTRSYSDLSDSATTFNPEEQLDRDIDERMKGMSNKGTGTCPICHNRTFLCPDGRMYCLRCEWKEERGKRMSKEEAVAKAIYSEFEKLPIYAQAQMNDLIATELSRAAIAAADKWDAEQRAAAADDLLPRQHLDPDKWPSRSNISAGQDAAIQEELDHPPASIMEEGK